MSDKFQSVSCNSSRPDQNNTNQTSINVIAIVSTVPSITPIKSKMYALIEPKPKAIIAAWPPNASMMNRGGSRQ